MWTKIVDYLLGLLDEPSTWLGIRVILAMVAAITGSKWLADLLAFNIDWGQMAIIGSIIFGVIEIIRKEKK